jgi:hypothetical protein
MPVDRVENWKRFSEHMEEYIRDRTVEKYGFGDAGEGEKGAFDLMSITKPTCVSGIFCGIRSGTGMEKGKEHDLEKIAHYAELAWTMG